MRRLIITAIAFTIAIAAATARNVTITASHRPAAEVFGELMIQTGKNFVYSSDILDGVVVSVNAKDKPLKQVLRQMFKGTGIEFRIKGNDVLLKRSRRPVETRVKEKATVTGLNADSLQSMLDEVLVVSRLEAPVVETVEMGAKKLTASEINHVPVFLGETDVIKALHMQPGVTEGTEGMAGMYVHGGNADENLYMLDNVPLYQANHFAGLFSAFNVDVIRYIDFFRSSMPAKYDGRLSSFLDVRTVNGSPDGHHGSARLGLTSGAFNIGGPIGGSTTYNVALRRSWYDVLTIPLLAVINSASDDEKIRFRYAFMDLNAKICHRFSDRTSGHLSIYFGNDQFHTGDKSDGNYDYGYYYDDSYDFFWGNMVAQAGVIHRLTPQLSAEFTAAYTRFFSNLKKYESSTDKEKDKVVFSSWSSMKTDNNINDWIARADFNWNPADHSRIRFGANYTLHSFLPARTSRKSSVSDVRIESRDSTWSYLASEFNAYIEDDWRISSCFHANVGLHASAFLIDKQHNFGVSPRLSVSYNPHDDWAIKGAYSHTVQYVHQLSQSYLALPTDQWIPITGGFKPETADKVTVGAYWQSPERKWTASVEGYWKEMHNLVDYRDEYYLRPPLEMWNARLTSGSGTAKGIDFKFERTGGRVTGHVAYSLAWSDRKFADKNGGKRFPSRFDNRHTINILINWQVSKKVELNAGWTGHSGNRFTLLTQTWEGPSFLSDMYEADDVPLRAPVNNYQLPFYHRLDLSCTVRNSRGYWNFSLYNAYCHMNAVAVRRGHKEVTEFASGSLHHNSYPVFQKVSILPLIPSISYTWQF